MSIRACTLCVVVSLVLFAAGAKAAETDEGTGLAIAPGWELVRAHCGGCHSHRLVTSQRADRQTWLDIIRWMQATQNLWQFDEATENTILDYLAANYPPQPNRRRAPIPPTLMPPAEKLPQGPNSAL
jgi:mono/diheme cytochrome c family protein